MLAPFQELGDSVARQWEHAKRTEAAFIEIASNALCESHLLTAIEPEDIASWLFNAKEFPPQDLNDFGQPPVILYQGDGFYIQALFWLDATTAIHEHSFVGAFGVLHGGSVHSTYQFTPDKAYSNRLVAGSVKFCGSELLSRGDVRPILLAGDLIHALFHLDRPSVSIVVRTNSDETRPQFYYARPYLALEDHNLPAHLTIQRKMLDSLWKSDRPLFWRLAWQFAENCDPFMLYHALLTGFRDTTDSENWNALLEAARRNNGGLVDIILPCIELETRAARISSLRNTVHDKTHRLFLALLLNVPCPEEIYRLIGQHFPNEAPRELAVRWLREIFEKEQAGVKFTRSWMCLIERMLQDPDFENSREFLAQRFRANTKETEEKLRSTWHQLQSFEVVKPLMVTSPVAQVGLNGAYRVRSAKSDETLNSFLNSVEAAASTQHPFQSRKNQ